MPSASASNNRACPWDGDALHRRLDHAIEAAVGHPVVMGATVVLARDGRLIYRRAAGWADRERGVPMRSDTVFRLASMTKMIVSATALSLCDDGIMTLDAPVTRWLPDFRPTLPDGSRPIITIAHLLTHTAGLSYGFEQGEQDRYAPAGVSDGLDTVGFGLAENLRRLAGVPLFFRPGTAWQYSLATDVLGAAIEAASDSPLPDAVARRVTRPLGLSDTAFFATDRERLATAYMDGTPGPQRIADGSRMQLDTGSVRLSPSRIFDPGAYPCGGAGMVGTADEYLHFLEAIRTGGGGILRPETASRMVANAIGAVEVPSRGPGWGFGLGPLVLTDRKRAGSPHGNGTWLWGGVYGGHFWVDPVARLTLVVLTNTGVAGLWGPFPDSLVTAIYGGTADAHSSYGAIFYDPLHP